MSSLDHSGGASVGFVFNPFALPIGRDPVPIDAIAKPTRPEALS